MDTMLVRTDGVPARKKALAIQPEKVSEAWVRVQQTETEAEMLERQAREIAEQAERQKKEARESLEEVLAPLRKQRHSLLQSRDRRVREVAELSAKLARAQAELNKANEKLQTFDAEVENSGIPVVLLGAVKYKEEVNAKTENRTTLKPDMLGQFPPIIITGIKRHGTADQRCTIEIASDGSEFRARRLDVSDAASQPYTYSHRMSDVTTSPGWLETKDVAYAILEALGRVEEFPSLRPANDPETIEVNGAKLVA